MSLSRITLLALLFCAASSGLAGCGPGGKVAAVVNGQVITVKEVDDRMTGMSPATLQAMGNSRGRVLEQMVMESLLLQEARRRGLERDQEVQRLLREARRQVLFGRLVEVLRQEQKVEVPEEEISKYYEENRSDFAQPASARASHILVNDEEAAEKALSRIKAGEPFGKVAEEVSVDPSRANGGDIGFFSKGQVIPEFEQACQKLKPGEMSGVVKSSLGYHVILLAEKREARERPLEEVKDRIRRGLEQQQRQRHLEQVVQGLRSKAQIVLRDSTLATPAPAATEAVPPGLSAVPGEGGSSGEESGPAETEQGAPSS
ncbi:MAG: peptidyl-prolyl cis-trans isomerase [Candidatus Omnitrophica bacterium]|nr:peptidyl-prolyl cis-trans isomerase [Candidatus Omnitrophota bacterium]